MVEREFFGKGATFHHLGLAVNSIRDVSPSSTAVSDDTQRVWMAFLRLYGITIELLEPHGDDSPIARSLREGVKLLHLCYEVPDLEESLRVAKAEGFHRISRAVQTPVYENRRVVWVYSRDYGLFELLEMPSAPQAPGMSASH